MLPAKTIVVLGLAALGLALAAASLAGPGPGGRERRSGGGRGERPGSVEGEETGVAFAPNETLECTRHGVRLTLSFDAEDEVFRGTVENVSTERRSRVRVEVHLSSGLELGPTRPTDLAPGESGEVSLPAGGHRFESWRAHPEVGRDEHGSERHDSEHEGDHDSEH